MAKITGAPVMTGGQIYSSTTTGYSFLDLGQRVTGSNGSQFRYVKAGASDLVVGNVIQSSAYTTNHDALTPAAAASGAYSVTVTLANAAVTADQYKDGFLTIDTTPGLGESYTIAGHIAQSASTGTVVINLKEPIRTALTTSSRVSLRKNPGDGVIQAPRTTLTGSLVGVAMYPIVAASYGFVQTKGVAAVLSDSTSIIMGSAVSAPSTVAAGEITLNAAGFPSIGNAMQAASSAHTIPVDLDM